jgi:hypothetical protein
MVDITAYNTLSANGRNLWAGDEEVIAKLFEPNDDSFLWRFAKKQGGYVIANKGRLSHVMHVNANGTIDTTAFDSSPNQYWELKADGKLQSKLNGLYLTVSSEGKVYLDTENKALPVVIGATNTAAPRRVAFFQSTSERFPNATGSFTLDYLEAGTGAAKSATVKDASTLLVDGAPAAALQVTINGAATTIGFTNNLFVVNGLQTPYLRGLVGADGVSRHVIVRHPLVFFSATPDGANPFLYLHYSTNRPAAWRAYLIDNTFYHVPDSGGVGAGYYGVFLNYERQKGDYWNGYLQGGNFWHEPATR